MPYKTVKMNELNSNVSSSIHFINAIHQCIELDGEKIEAKRNERPLNL